MKMDSGGGGGVRFGGEEGGLLDVMLCGKSQTPPVQRVMSLGRSSEFLIRFIMISFGMRLVAEERRG